ncbi:MAG: ABC transporter ATP-binding protein [Flavobacteriales bacterium]|nr:ABC transporter ATP-binding protein [Flavobacteriales bacterium]
MSSLLLDIQNLNIDFPTARGTFRAVHGLNLQVQAGEIVAIVGESGSGKSVSMLALGRLLSENAILKADKLDYCYNGKMFRTLECSEQEMRLLRQHSIAYVFQEPMSALHPLFTCGFQVIEGVCSSGLLSKKEATSKAYALFEELRLPDPERIFHAYPHQLSGGQRQRVMLAMALMSDPDLVIADEPTTALDSVLQRAVIEIMANACKKRNAGLILISHDINVVRDYSDKTLVMYHGNLMETGITEQVLAQPVHPYTKALIACRPSFRSRNFSLPTINRLLEQDGDQFRELPFEAEAYPMRQLSEEIVCSIRNLRVSYPGRRKFVALNGIDLDVYKGETLGIVGESGSGKSTLAKVLTGLVTEYSGVLNYAFGDQSSRKVFARKVQMVFQDPYASLNPNQSVMDCLAEVLKVHRICPSAEIERSVHELLLEVGLKVEDAHKYPHEFSGGQRQRISIARALAVQPEIIVCDESVSALDVSVQAQILNLLKRLQISRDLTYLFITHDLDVVSYFSDRLLVLRNGEIVESGKTRRIVEDPQSTYCRELFAPVRHEMKTYD